MNYVASKDTSPQPQADRLASIVIPAHDETRVIQRLLSALCKGAAPNEFQTIVVCNGCTDDTADVCRSFGSGVLVVEISEPSKWLALRAGDEQATSFPRIYLDADVEMSTADARTLIAAFADPEVLAAAPTRLLDRTGVPLLVRWYYDIWERLPQVRDGLFGRGIIAVSEAGHRRVAALPQLMSDDLAMSEAFRPEERMIVDGTTVVVRLPRTMRDLLRRRVRVTTGVVQAGQAEATSAESRTSLRTLMSIIGGEPTMMPRVLVFLAVAVMSRIAARRRVASGDFHTWLRDESSRSA